MDTAPATTEVLPAIAEAVAGRMPVLLDGGVRRGLDILKAIALVANAVLVGRPVLEGELGKDAPPAALHRCLDRNQGVLPHSNPRLTKSLMLGQVS